MDNVLYAFRGSLANQPEHRFMLAGVQPGKYYRLHFEDGTQQDREVPRIDLLSEGPLVRLHNPLSSELVFLDEVAAGK